MKYTKSFLLLTALSLIVSGCTLFPEKDDANNTMSDVDLSNAVDTIPETVEEVTDEASTLDASVDAEAENVLATVDLAANQPVTLQVGQVAEFGPNGMSVTLDSISSEGEVNVSMNTIYQADAEASAQLPDQAVIDMGGDGGISYKLRLDSVSVAEDTINSTATFTFIVNEE